MTAPASSARPTAAFFDVDGTLTRTNIVHYYAYFRRRLLGDAAYRWWRLGLLAACVYYWLLDKFDRSKLNVLFYRNYAHLPVEPLHELAGECHRDVILPRRFPQGFARLAEERAAGRRIVLVTGSIDFIMAPLAGELQVDDLLAPGLAQRDGYFTGDLTGPPLSDDEKARRMRAYAEQHDLDLAGSTAFADSLADLPMLEAVGQPHVVNPDSRLARIARERSWPCLRWSTEPAPEDA